LNSPKKERPAENQEEVSTTRKSNPKKALSMTSTEKGYPRLKARPSYLAEWGETRDSGACNRENSPTTPKKTNKKFPTWTGEGGADQRSSNSDTDGVKMPGFRNASTSSTRGMSRKKEPRNLTNSLLDLSKNKKRGAAKDKMQYRWDYYSENK